MRRTKDRMIAKLDRSDVVAKIAASDTDYTKRHLTDLDLTSLVFTAGSDFYMICLNNSDLTGSSMIDADLEGVNFCGCVLGTLDVTNASMYGAILVGCDLDNVDFGNSTDGYADLENAKIDKKYEGSALLADCVNVDKVCFV